MKVLLTNIEHASGGSEGYTFSLGKELQRLGHEIEFMFPDATSWKRHFEKLAKVRSEFDPTIPYDLILCNHASCLAEIKSVGTKIPIIYTCHTPFLEKEPPLYGAARYVATSEEVSDALLRHGFQSTIIRQGIDPDYFTPTREADRNPEIAIYLTESDEFIPLVDKACQRAGIELIVIGYPRDEALWDPMPLIDMSDIVIALGRGAYEGLMLDKAVLLFDHFGGDGWLTPESWGDFVKRDCSGRTNRRAWSDAEWRAILSQYRPPRGENRRLALQEHNISTACSKYLAIADELGIA